MDAVSDEQSLEADNVDVSIRCYMVHDKASTQECQDSSESELKG